MPVIDRGDDYFQAGIYTGNGSTQTISGLRFQPDFVWIKGRSGATDHALYDAVRGATKQLESNQTGAESTESTGLTAFTSDGFTLGSLAQVNTNAATYAYWAWKANGAGSTNTAGSISSTVSANTTSGFSIVRYTGQEPTPGTIGHGLGVAPSMIITKNRSGAGNWGVYHKFMDASSPQAYYAQLNSTSAKINATDIWNNTAPTSTVFSVGNAGTTNANGSSFVAYCFAPVAGYSAFGSYTGNGSADGPMIFTNFRPALVLVKSSSGVDNWIIVDDKRDPQNIDTQKRLFPESSSAESAAQCFDFLSNGFKARRSVIPNVSGQTYIYAAFASNPFKYSLAY